MAIGLSILRRSSASWTASPGGNTSSNQPSLTSAMERAIPAGLREFAHLFADFLSVDGRRRVADDSRRGHRICGAAEEFCDRTISKLGRKIPSREVHDRERAKPNAATV